MGAGGSRLLLVDNHFEILAGEWQLARQRLIKDYADAVPITRLWKADTGHPVRATCNRVYLRAVPISCKPLRFNFGDQPEIKNHHATFSRHQNIRRLDIAMQFAGFVQAKQALSQLSQG